MCAPPSTYPLCVLKCPDEQVDQPRDRSVLSQRRVVGRAERQVPDETDDGLDQRPPRRGVHQPDDGREAALEPHGVLGHLALLVAGGEVAQGAHGRLGDLLTVTGSWERDERVS